MVVKSGIWGRAPLIVTMAGALPTAADDRTACPEAKRDCSIHGAVNNGEDLTRPTGRFDLRRRYERLPEEDGLKPEKWVTAAPCWRSRGRG